MYKILIYMNERVVHEFGEMLIYQIYPIKIYGMNWHVDRYTNYINFGILERCHGASKKR